MRWEVEYTDEFGAWWGQLSGEEQDPLTDRLYDDHLKQLQQEGGRDV